MRSVKTITFPFTVARGSVSVKIYRTPSHGCDSFTLAYWQDGVRKRLTFAAFEKAKQEAEAVVGRMASSDANVFTLTNADGAAYQRARQLLDPVGVAIEMAAAEFAAAKARLGDVPLAHAVDYYLRRHPTKMVPRTVAEVIQELLQTKAGDGLSETYVRHLRYDLEKFGSAFHCNIASVTGADVDAWLRGLGVAPRTRNNLRNAVQTLFNFAVARKYLPKDHDELEAVARAKDGDGEIEIFKSQELREILGQAGDAMIPFVVIGAFAGIRHAEIQRLDWRDIQFDAGIVEIRAKKAKTASRRTVPLLPNLRAWLEPLRRREGPVCAYQNVASEIDDLVQRVNQARRATWAEAEHVSGQALKEAEKRARKRLADLRAQNKDRLKRGARPPLGAETASDEGWTAFEWKHNALRHSFISYRVAQIQNVAQVALEAGNSPQMIFKHYRELVRPKEAEAWFGIMPAPGEVAEALHGVKNVVELKQAA
jgi:integrase